LTRAQAVALLAAYPTAVVAVASGDGTRGFQRRLRRYWPSAVVGGIALAAVAAWESLHGRSVFAALGKGQGLESSSYSIGAVAKWFVYHVAELDLYVGILPFAAFIVLAAWSVRKPDRDAFVFTATALSLGFWLLLTVAMFTSILSTYDPHSRSHVFDRYTFYLVPLLLIALCAWASRRVSLSTRGTAIAALIAGCLPLVLPYRHLIRADVVPDAVGLLPWIVNKNGSIEARPNVVAAAALASFALAALFFLLRRGKMTSLPVVITVLWLGTTLIVAGRWYWVEGTAAKASPPDRAWVDHALPPGGMAVAIWSGVQAPYLIWQNEFFNRSIGDVYYLRHPTWQGLPEQKLAVRHSVLVDTTGRPLRASYILADPWLVLQAPVVARDRVSGMRLYRLAGRPARIGVL
jgi:hypothetical protein